MYDKNYTRLHLGDKVNFSDEYGNKCSQIMSFTPTGNIIVRKDRYSPMEVIDPRTCEVKEIIDNFEKQEDHDSINLMGE